MLAPVAAAALEMAAADKSEPATAAAAAAAILLDLSASAAAAASMAWPSLTPVLAAAELPVTVSIATYVPGKEGPQTVVGGAMRGNRQWW